MLLLPVFTGPYGIKQLIPRHNLAEIKLVRPLPITEVKIMRRVIQLDPVSIHFVFGTVFNLRVFDTA